MFLDVQMLSAHNNCWLGLLVAHCEKIEHSL